MDNITHTLFGVTLARTPLGRAGSGTTAALVLASNAPDIDIVTTAGGAVSYLEWHRGPTHGPLGILALGVVSAAIVWGIARMRRGRQDKPAASFAALVAVSIVGVALHVAMDIPTSYGTRFLSPFDWRWFAADWMPIVDIYLLAALGAGLVFGRRPEARRRNAVIVLVLMAANYGLRAATHQQAVAAAPQVFGPRLSERCPASVPAGRVVDWWPQAAAQSPVHDRCLIEVAALPTFLSPFRWRMVAHLSGAYEIRDMDLLNGRLRDESSPGRLWRLSQRQPNHWTPIVEAAAVRSRVAQVFLGFSRFPAARSVEDKDGSVIVRWSDVRFDGPGPIGRERANARGLFSVFVRLSPDGEILSERLGG
jgi:inner membrane protein